MLRNEDVFEKCIERQSCAYIGEEEVGIRSRLLSRARVAVYPNTSPCLGLSSRWNTPTQGGCKCKDTRGALCHKTWYNLCKKNHWGILAYFKKILYHQTTYKPTQTEVNSIYFSEELEQPFPSYCPLLTPPPLITPCHVDSPLSLPWEKDTFGKLFFLLGDQKLTGPIFRKHISLHQCAWGRQSCTWIIETTVNKTKRGIN